jgi:amino acid adenylation domain-containing protein
MDMPSPHTVLSVADPEQACLNWPDGRPRWLHLADAAESGLRRYPDALALVFRHRTWTASEVLLWSDAVSAAIQDRLGASAAGERVALLVRRGPSIVVGMIGIAQAGCVIVPIDAEQPAERIAMILADANPALILVDDEQTARPSDPGSEKILTIEGLETASSPLPTRALRSNRLVRDGREPAYIMYTSGSTGRPRGVVCHHLGICNLIEDRLAMGTVPLGSRLLLTTSISFDPAIYNVFLAATTGSCLVIADDTAASSGAMLADLMREHAISHIDMPPGLLAAIPPGAFPDLRAASLGGEACPQHVVDEWAPRIVLENCYGPTETAVEVTRWRWSRGEPGTRIGRPLRNVMIRVVGEDGASADAGELWIGGPMVSLGYLNRPEESADRFVRCAETDLMFYRTGDRVRCSPEGVLDFVGRLDEQIKIDSVRIELEEVRAAIEALPEVRRAALLVESGEVGVRLTAFYTSTPDAPDRTDIMERLARRLPAAMLPTRLVSMPELPVLPSGKIDVQALRRHFIAERSAPAFGSGSLPGTDVAQYLAALWCKLLNVPQVKPSDNFFELGGDSMRLTQLIFTINKKYRVRLTPVAYRRLSDLSALVAHVESALAEGPRQ